MLTKTPSGASDELITMWHKMRQMDLNLFDKYWYKIETKKSMLDWSRSSYEKEWYSDRTFQTYHGTRNIESGLPDGVVREIDDDGDAILEGSFIDGLKNGLVRLITADYVQVALANGDRFEAYFRFDHDFNPGIRIDEDKLLDGLDANFFKR